MTVAERYRALVAGVSAEALAEIWRAALFGRPIADELRGALAELQALRCDVGRASAARSSAAALVA